MQNHSIYSLSVRPCHTKERGKYTRGRSTSRGKYKSAGDPLKRLCWKCDKPGHFKKKCR